MRAWRPLMRVAVISLWIAGGGCRGDHRPWVVAYVSQDQVFAEPILREFTRETGIEVRALYDSEAIKTVGLVNRLLAEQQHPQCDLFWNNEALRTQQLLARGVLRENACTAFGFRSRRLVINTNQIRIVDAPRRISDLTNSVFRGRFALAYPLFGTTATHFLALRQKWGVETWTHWCRLMQANKPLLVDGNSVVVQLVGRGEAAIGLTDSDDVAAGQREGLPVAALPLTSDSLLIPNTVAIVEKAPHPEAAQRLFEFLQRPKITQQLIATNALEGADAGAVSEETLRPDARQMVVELDAAIATLKEIFLR